MLSFVISVVLTTALAIIIGVYKSKNVRRDLKDIRTGTKKSKWQQRIDEMKQRQAN